MRAIGRRGYGLLQAGEAVDEVVNAEQGQDAADGTVRGNDEPQLAAFCKDALVYRYQGMDGGRVTEPGAGHVHHKRPVSILRRCGEDSA